MVKTTTVLFIFSSFLMMYPLQGKLNEISSKTGHPKTILDEVLENPSLSSFAKVIVKSDLVEYLDNQDPFTLFAPTNEAFEKLPPGTFDSWVKPSNKEKFTAILRYHMVLGKITLEDMKKNNGLMTLEGSHVNTKVDKNKVTVNNATVVESNLEYPNGAVYIIDQVLIPKSQYVLSPQEKSWRQWFIDFFYS